MTNKDQALREQIKRISTFQQSTSHGREWCFTDENINDIIALFTKYAQARELEGSIIALEWVLDGEDQEVDGDGRPTTKPYKLFHSTSSEVELIETKIADLKAQLAALEGGE